MTVTTFAQEICRHLSWNIQLKIKPERSEKLYVSQKQGALTIQASNPLVELFAVQTFPFALKANHLGDFVGTSEPRYPLRALWLDKTGDEDAETVLRCIIGCGFNCVLGGAIPDELLKAYGMLDARLVTPKIVKSEPTATYKESLLQAIKQDESGNTLFYIPNAPIAARQAEWLPLLLDDMGENSWLAVDRDHPFWPRLRMFPDCSSTPVAVVASPDKLLQELLPQCGKQIIKGVVVRIDSWPKENSKEAGELWIAGQSLWWDISPEALAETWNRVFLAG